MSGDHADFSVGTGTERPLAGLNGPSRPPEIAPGRGRRRGSRGGVPSAAGLAAWPDLAAPAIHEAMLGLLPPTSGFVTATGCLLDADRYAEVNTPTCAGELLGLGRRHRHRGHHGAPHPPAASVATALTHQNERLDHGFHRTARPRPR